MKPHTLIVSKGASGDPGATISPAASAAFKRQFHGLNLRVPLGKQQVYVWDLRDDDLRRVAQDDMVRVVKLVSRNMTGRQYRGQTITATPAQRDKLLKVVLHLCLRQASIQAGQQAASVVRRTLRCARKPEPEHVVQSVADKVENTISGYFAPVIAEVARERPQAPGQSLSGAASGDWQPRCANAEGSASADETSSDIEFGNAGPVSSSLAALSSLLEVHRSAAVGELLRQPDMLPSQEFADRIALTRQQLNAWRKQGKVLAIEGAKRGFRYPAWQVAEDGRILDGIPQIIAEFGGQHVAAYRFLSTPLEILGGKAPWMLLRDGQRQRIVDLAKGARRGDYF